MVVRRAPAERDVRAHVDENDEEEQSEAAGLDVLPGMNAGDSYGAKQEQAPE